MHPKYLGQVLLDRGIPQPPLRQLEVFVDLLSEAERRLMEERLRKLALGAETQEDLEALLDGIRAHSPNAQRLEAEPDPPPARTEAEPTRKAKAATEQRPAPAPAPADDKLPADVLDLLRQHGLHVYATKAALKIELATLRAGEASGSLQYTVQIDAARAKANGYDWRSKVPFQFTKRELPLLAAFLLGMGGKKLTFANHGPNTDKHFEVEDQGSHLFVKVRVAGGPTIAVPIAPADVFGWGEICLVALQLNRPALGIDGHLALLRRVGRMEPCRD
jgi:hypothetical protein